MRILEITIPLFLATFLLWHNPKPVVIRYAPAFAFLITLIHFAVEGYRWQMIPLYALVVILTIICFFISDIKSIASFFILFLLAVSSAVPVLLPVPKIPTPSGAYSIGTSIYEMTDSSRKEIYSGKDEARRFMFQAWYPAKLKSTDVKAPWMTNAEIYTPAIATYINLPSYFLNHLGLVNIPAYQNAEIETSETGFPVILFSHGWNGFNAQNTGQALELASHGYVVIALQHTYGAVITVFPDGSIALNNPNALPEDDAVNYEVTARILVEQWAGDMSYLLDQLEDVESEAGSFFNPHIDLARIGAYGHSTGGGAAIQFCGVDLRCKAVLGMDPFMRPVSAEVIENGVSQPSFFIFSQSWTDLVDSKNNKLFHQFYSNASKSKGAITIIGTKHYDFSDLPLLSPIAPQLGLKGPLKGARVIEIINSYLLDFFELVLNDKTSTLFEGSFTDFSEIQVRK